MLVLRADSIQAAWSPWSRPTNGARGNQSREVPVTSAGAETMAALKNQGVGCRVQGVGRRRLGRISRYLERRAPGAIARNHPERRRGIMIGQKSVVGS
jgi:hypothetical protein